MKDQDSYIFIRKELENSGGSNLWLKEIQNIYFGNRIFIKEGKREKTYHEYIQEIIEDSTDPIASTIEFKSALNDFLTEWKPSTNESPSYIFNLYEMVKGFTPKRGAFKILSYLKLLYNEMDVLVDKEITSSEFEDLIFEGLLTLSVYFEETLESSDEIVKDLPIFSQYIESLNLIKFRFSPKINAFAIYKLIVHSRLLSENSSITDYLKSNKESMELLMCHILESYNFRKFESMIKYFYVYEKQILNEVLEATRAKIKVGELYDTNYLILDYDGVDKKIKINEDEIAGILNAIPSIMPQELFISSLKRALISQQN